MKNVLIITHSNYIKGEYVLGPGDHIRNFLEQNFIKADILSLGFSNYGVNKFQSEEKVYIKKTLRNPIKYLTDLFLIKKNYKIIIACDPLSFVSAYFIYIFKNINIYFYILDYSNHRFNKNSILNFIYKLLVKFSIYKSYKIISVSEKISEDLNLGDKLINFPNYPLDRTYQYKIHNFDILKFVISYTDIKNIDFKLIINVVSNLIKFNKLDKKIIVTFIGVVENEPDILNYAKSQNVLDAIKYLGAKDRDTYFSILSRSNIGIEVNSGLQTYNEYRDPIKIRDYIFHSMPIISRFGHAANDYIFNNKLGWIFSNEDEFEEIIISIDKSDLLLVASNTAMKEFYNFNPKILIESILEIRE
jgi:hypothetical protein